MLEYFPLTKIKYSNLKNEYVGFDSPKAINTIAAIENDYFSNYHKGVSKYYGSNWSGSAYIEVKSGEGTYEWDAYKNEMDTLNIKPEMYHCMVYIMKALKSGLGDNYKKLQQYLFLRSSSEEYNRCVKNFNKNKTYFVWKQPDIKLEKIFFFEKDEDKMNKLLSQHKFGWGFSHQGIHNWITRFTVLKECMWEGAPCAKYNASNNQYLFKATKFTEFNDYESHVIVFPPKKEN